MIHFKYIQKHLNVTEVRSQRLRCERQNGGWHMRTWCWSGSGVRRYDRLDDTALTNVDNSQRVPGDSHDQQWLVLIWVTWSQGPQKWAAVTFPLGTRAVWAGTADAAVCCCTTFFIYLFIFVWLLYLCSVFCFHNLYKKLSDLKFSWSEPTSQGFWPWKSPQRQYFCNLPSSASPHQDASS